MYLYTYIDSCTTVRVTVQGLSLSKISISFGRHNETTQADADLPGDESQAKDYTKYFRAVSLTRSIGEDRYITQEIT